LIRGLPTLSFSGNPILYGAISEVFSEFSRIPSRFKV
jgi:hypothetical protein